MSESPVAVTNSRPTVRAHDCFVTHFCNQVLKSGSIHSVSEVRKMAEERWKGMTTAEKRPYKEIALQKREELGLEMPAGATMKVENPRKRKRAGGKAGKDPNAPKRAITAFFYFSHEQRSAIKASNPEFKVTDISKELGKLWKAMSDKQKEKYVRLADKDKIRYEEEKAAYENRGASQGSGDEGDE